MRRRKAFALWCGALSLTIFLTTFLPGCGGGGGTVTRIVSGVLTDAVTGQPIDGATVELYQAPAKGRNNSRVMAGAMLLGKDTTHDGGKYSIPIHISGMLVAIFSVQPPPGTDYEPLEMETNIDASQNICLDVVIIAESNKPSGLEIIPPLPPGESYIAGQTYHFGYKAYNQNGQEIQLNGVNWYAKGGLARINSQGEFIASSPATCIIGIILSSDCKTEISIPIIAPPQAILVGSSASNPLRDLLRSAGFNVLMQSTVPTNIGGAKVLVIDDTANLTTADASKVENILNKGGNVVLIGDAPAMLATGHPLPPNNPDNQNWTPTDISTISSWFGGATKMLHTYDFGIHPISGGLVPLPPGVNPEVSLDFWEAACTLTPLNPYPIVSVIASTEYWFTSPDFPNTEVGGWGPHKVYAFAQASGNGRGRLYWQWGYKTSLLDGKPTGDEQKIKMLLLNGVKWAAGTLITPQ